jgi:predicted kinase
VSGALDGEHATVHDDAEVRDARRILVVGGSGAGKSTVGRQLAARTGLPLIHLDSHFWRSGWHATPPGEWRSRVSREIIDTVHVLRARRIPVAGPAGF